MMKRHIKRMNMLLLTLIVTGGQVNYIPVPHEQTVQAAEEEKKETKQEEKKSNPFISRVSGYSYAGVLDYIKDTNTYLIKQDRRLKFQYRSSSVRIEQAKETVEYVEVDNRVTTSTLIQFYVDIKQENADKYKPTDVICEITARAAIGSKAEVKTSITLGDILGYMTTGYVQETAKVEAINTYRDIGSMEGTGYVLDNKDSLGNKCYLNRQANDWKFILPKSVLSDWDTSEDMQIQVTDDDTIIALTKDNTETKDKVTELKLDAEGVRAFNRMLAPGHSNSEVREFIITYPNKKGGITTLKGMKLTYDVTKPEFGIKKSPTTAMKDNIMYVLEGTVLELTIKDNTKVSSKQADLVLHYKGKTAKDKDKEVKIPYKDGKYVINNFENLKPELNVTLKDIAGNTQEYTSLWQILSGYDNCKEIKVIKKDALPRVKMSALYGDTSINDDENSNVFPLNLDNEYVATVEKNKSATLLSCSVEAMYTVYDNRTGRVLQSDRALMVSEETDTAYIYKINPGRIVPEQSDTRIEITFDVRMRTLLLGNFNQLFKHTLIIDDTSPTLAAESIAQQGTARGGDKFYTKSTTEVKLINISEPLQSIKVYANDKELITNKISQHTFRLAESGKYKVEVTDKVGNKSVYKLSELLSSQVYENIVIDDESPKISLKNEGMKRGTVHYYKTDSLDLEVQIDEENLKDVGVLVNNAPYTMTNNIIHLTETNKVIPVTIMVEDLANNHTEVSYNIYLDTKAPVLVKGELSGTSRDNTLGGLTFTGSGGVRFESTDAEGAGVKSTQIYLNGSSTPIDKDSSGYYPLAEGMTELKIVCTDLLGNTASYTLDQVPKWENTDKKLTVDNLIVDTTKPVIEIHKPVPAYQNTNNQDYFNKDQIITVTLKDDAALESSVIKINNQDVLTWTADSRVNKKDVEIDTSKYEVAPDGSYLITVELKDTAQNEVSDSYKFYIDDKKPEITQFIFTGTGHAEGMSIGGSDVYGFYFNGDAKVEIHAQDPNPGAGIKSIYYELIDSKGSVVDKKTVTEIINNVITVELPQNFKGYVRAYAVDFVNNTGSFEQPDGVINTTINTTDIDIQLPATKYRDHTGNQLYNSKIEGQIVISNDGEGLRTITWGYRTGETDVPLGKAEIDNKGRVSGDKGSISQVDKNLVLDMSKGFQINENVNSIVIYVQVVNRIGEVSETERVISIDTDTPEIEVTYNSTNAKGMYNQDREVTIAIKERNFNAAEVTTPGITNLSAWTTEGDVHTAKAVFNKDGDFQFNVDYTDMAGNHAKGYVSENFTIDKTLPTAQVTYSRESALNEIYYNNSRTARVVITEHNFDPKAIVVETTGIQGEWVSTDDTHVMTIMFNKDGEHHLTLKGEDKAGNLLEENKGAMFVIDTVSPTIAISGLEDGVSYKEDLNPSIVMADSYIDPDTIDIYLESNKHGTMACTGTVNEKTGTYKLPEIPQKSGYDDAYRLVISLKDKAGNSASKVVDFTVNRFGSAYDIAGEDVIGTYTNTLPPEITIAETSVDKIDLDKTTLYINKDGQEYAYSTDLLTKLEEETEQNEYKYTYKLNSAAFKEDGKYSLSIVSVADDGTRNTSQREDYTFIYDTTEPEIIMNGLDSSKVYNTPVKKFSVSVQDMSDIMETDFKINGEEVTAIADSYNTYNMELQREDHQKQEVTIYVKDRAGNVSEKVISGVVVSDNYWDTLTTESWPQFLVCGLILLAVIIFIISQWRYRKRIKKHEEDVAIENAES